MGGALSGFVGAGAAWIARGLVRRSGSRVRGAGPPGARRIPRDGRAPAAPLLRGRDRARAAPGGFQIPGCVGSLGVLGRGRSGASRDGSLSGTGGRAFTSRAAFGSVGTTDR